MIKVDIYKYITDRTWFGWYHVGWNIKEDGEHGTLWNAVWWREVKRKDGRILVTHTPKYNAPKIISFPVYEKEIKLTVKVKENGK